MPVSSSPLIQHPILTFEKGLVALWLSCRIFVGIFLAPYSALVQKLVCTLGQTHPGFPLVESNRTP